jgi:aminoglycoside phosphotransferase (APT) family kinase protein
VTETTAGTGEIPRPTTSTRDRDELRRRLEAWLAQRLGPATHPRVVGIDPPGSNGLSSETLLFEAAWDGPDGAVSRRLVARLAPDPSDMPVFPVYDMGRQFRIMQLVRERSSVPVPEVLWHEDDPTFLGTPFFVMERVDGRVPPDIMPYNFGSWVTEASEEDRAHLEEASVAVLAGIHGIADPVGTFAPLLGDPGPSALRRHVDAQRAYYRWVAAAGPRSPLIERCFDWLDDNWPDGEGPTVLSWGDARIGNILYDGFDPVAVLDWEMADLAPPEVDLGWMIALHEFFEHVAANYGLPGLPDFFRPDRVAATYERLAGYTPRNLEWFRFYAALRHGIIMFRISQRAVHFGEQAPPDDPDDRITHRGLLEAMLDGSHWRR